MQTVRMIASNQQSGTMESPTRKMFKESEREDGVAENFNNSFLDDAAPQPFDDGGADPYQL